MNILLLGKTGQVGFELARALPLLGEVSSLTTAELDPAKADEIAAKVRALRPAAIVNATAYTAVDRAEEDSAAAFSVNESLPTLLAKLAAENHALLVHYSTDYVYDGQKPEPYRETDRTNPLSVYGRSKLAGEEGIRAHCEQHLIFRTSWVYGVHGKNFIKTILRLAAERESLSIVSDQIGAPTGARLLADATTQALRIALDRKSVAGTYHLAASGAVSWHGLASRVVQRMRDAGRPVKVTSVLPIPAADYKTAAQRPQNSRLDCSRFEAAFNIRLPEWQIGVDQVLEQLTQ